MTSDGGSGQINTLKGSFLRTVDIFTAHADSRSPIKYTAEVPGGAGSPV